MRCWFQVLLERRRSIAVTVSDIEGIRLDAALLVRFALALLVSVTAVDVLVLASADAESIAPEVANDVLLSLLLLLLLETTTNL
jgi:hypothetical protein